jgi:uncharacterized protein YkwD
MPYVRPPALGRPYDDPLECRRTAQMVHAKAPRLLALCSALLLLALPATASAGKDGGKRKARSAQQCANTDVVPDAGSVAEVRAAVLCLHNRVRAERGLPPLREHAKLREAAEGHSDDMVARGYFSHDAPDGDDMVDRILSTGYARGADAWSVGENIAYATGELATAAQIHRAWMRSPGHRANILRRPFREIGIGIALGAPVEARGQDGATYTADFGLRR